jgi:hypothetical protein
MKNFAVLSGLSVVNVIAAENLESAELATKATCIEYTQENPAGVGWTYVDGVFIAPPEIIDETIPE